MVNVLHIKKKKEKDNIAGRDPNLKTQNRNMDSHVFVSNE